MESPNDEVKVAEQITLYENKIKEIKQKIRDELQVRRDLKAKIEDAKKKEALQIQILERLDEYEKIVTKQIQLAKVQEDSDSIKQKSIVKKYENMLNEQQDVWAKYEEKYEQIPLAQEKRSLEIRLTKGQIDTQIIQYKINEAKQIKRTMDKINNRREQLEIIEFARVFVEYKKKDKHFEELRKKEQQLKKKKKDLQAETEYLKQKATEKAKVMNKTLLKTQQLPEIDLSRYSIRKNNSNCDLNFDTVSINSYMLEQEYMNTDDQEPPTTKQNQESDSKKRKSNDNKDGSEPMDFKVSEEQVTQHKPKSKQKRVEFNESVNMVRSNHGSQESQMDSMELDEQPPTITGAANLNQSLINVDENSPFAMNDNQHIDYMNPQLCQERPVPTPAKMMRHSSQEQQKQQFQQEHLKQQQLYQQKMLQYQQQQQQLQQKEMEQQQHLLQKQQQQQQQMLQQQHQEQLYQQQQQKHQQMQKQQQQQQMLQKQQQQQYQLQQQQQQQQQQHLSSSRRDIDQRNYNMDSSRQMPQSNKPTIKSVEQVHYPNVSKGQNQKPTMIEIQQNTPASAMQIKSAAQRQQETPSASSMQNLLASPLWEVTMPPELKQSINDPRMNPEIASTSMMSTDMNFFQDNISAILGSEITEPGGSFELKKRLYADSDMNSEAGSIDYEKMYGNISPPPGLNMNLQQRQAEMNNMDPQPQNEKNKSAKPSGQDASKNFTFGQFTRKQPLSRFF